MSLQQVNLIQELRRKGFTIDMCRNTTMRFAKEEVELVEYQTLC